VTVLVTGVDASGLHYDTGFGVEGASNEVEIRVYDKCRFVDDGSGENGAVSQELLGIWYPASMATTIDFIETDMTGVNAPSGTGTGNVIQWQFMQGISQNPAVYTQFNTSYAELAFCVQIGLFIDDLLTSWDEFWMFIPLNMGMTLGGQAGAGEQEGGGGGGLGIDLNITTNASMTFFGAFAFNYTLPEGSMSAYFCNANTQAVEEMGTKKHTGSVISVCFTVAEGLKFKIEDIVELHIEDILKTKAVETIVSGGNVASPSYVQKTCVWNTPTTRSCIVSFILRADFFDSFALALTGYGAIRLRFGEGAGGARRDRRVLVRMQTRRAHHKRNASDVSTSRFLEGGEEAVAGFRVDTQTYYVDDRSNPAADQVSSATTSKWPSHHHVVMMLTLTTMMASWLACQWS
jgi:hypothetical protein